MMFLYKNVFPLVSDWLLSAVSNIITWHGVAAGQFVQCPRWVCSAAECAPLQLQLTLLLCRSLRGEFRAPGMT